MRKELHPLAPLWLVKDGRDQVRIGSWNKARAGLALSGISTALNSAGVACLKRGEALSEINVSSSLTSIDKSKPTLETHQNREP